jgi:hypothetical protein
MLSLRRRIAALEGSITVETEADRIAMIQIRALASLRPDQLVTMRDFVRDRVSGVERPMSAEEEAAHADFRIALKEACERRESPSGLRAHVECDSAECTQGAPTRLGSEIRV